MQRSGDEPRCQAGEERHEVMARLSKETTAGHRADIKTVALARGLALMMNMQEERGVRGEGEFTYSSGNMPLGL